MKKFRSQQLFILLTVLLATAVYYWYQTKPSNQNWDTKFIELPDTDQLQHRIDQQMQNKESQTDRQIGADIEQIVDQQAMQAKLSGLTKNITLLRDPTQAELKAFFKLHQEDYREISLFSFKQLLFPKTKFGGQAVNQAKKSLDKITAEPNSLKDQIQEQLHLSSLQLDELYGQGYSDKLLSLATDKQSHSLPCWSQPVTSKVGAHLMCFESVTPGAIPELESIKSQVINDWRYAVMGQLSE